MRIVRFSHSAGPRYGIIDGTDVAVIDPHPFTTYRPTGERLPIESLQLLAPVIPSKIVCVGRNYADHARELGNDVPADTLYFLKPSSAVVGPGEPIRLPTDLASDFSYEAELAVVIGALVQRATPEQAMAAVFGYTAANDVTARDWQQREHQWFRAKAFDSFCPLGPAIATEIDPAAVTIRSWVDGALRQDGSSADMIRDVATLVSEISHVTTLLPSDVVLTGTPAGVGRLEANQLVRVEIEGIGALENPTIDRVARPS